MGSAHHGGTDAPALSGAELGVQVDDTVADDDHLLGVVQHQLNVPRDVAGAGGQVVDVPGADEQDIGHLLDEALGAVDALVASPHNLPDLSDEAELLDAHIVVVQVEQLVFDHLLKLGIGVVLEVLEGIHGIGLKKGLG